MRSLTLILTSDDADRTRSGIEIVGAQAALGGRARLHFDRAATARLGDPFVRDSLGEVAALGVTVSACPTGIGDAQINPGTLPPGVETFGLVALLGSLTDDARLVTL